MVNLFFDTTNLPFFVVDFSQKPSCPVKNIVFSVRFARYGFASSVKWQDTDSQDKKSSVYAVFSDWSFCCRGFSKRFYSKFMIFPQNNRFLCIQR